MILKNILKLFHVSYVLVNTYHLLKQFLPITHLDKRIFIIFTTMGSIFSSSNLRSRTVFIGNLQKSNDDF